MNLLHRRPVAVDIFAGVGGLSLGFEQAGFDVVAAVEYDPIHAAIHRLNFPLTEVLIEDAADENAISSSSLTQAIKLGIAAHRGDVDNWDGDVDVVFGGPPCQGFSSMGKRDTSDVRNKLVFHFARIVLLLSPKYFVMENVPGLVTKPNRALLSKLIRQFASAGYEVHEHRVLNASDFGVPQDRKRVILMGSRKDSATPNYPIANRNLINEQSQPSRDSHTPTVAEAIGDLPKLKRKRRLYLTDETELTAREIARGLDTASLYARLLRGIADDPTDFSYKRIYPRTILTATTLTDHAPPVVARFEKTPAGTVEPTSRFFKLDADGISNTLRAGTGSERGSYTSARPIHPWEARVITVREAARLHSFPDWFRFHKTKWHGFRQVGNSVPPLLGRAVAREIIKALAISPIKPSKVIRMPATSQNH